MTSDDPADDTGGTDIGRAIYARRTALGLTQQELADRLDTSGATVARWEAGKRGVKVADLGRIAEALQTTVADLVGREAATPPPPPPAMPLDIDPLLLEAWKRMSRKSRKQLVQFALIMASDG